MQRERLLNDSSHARSTHDTPGLRPSDDLTRRVFPAASLRPLSDDSPDLAAVDRFRVVGFVLGVLTFDFAAYVIVHSMEDFIIRLPPWYSYGMWFREPFFLKWYVLSHAGPLRFVPFLPAVVVAVVLQVIVFEAQINFGFGLLIVFLQWTATIVAGYIVSLLFGVALSAIGWAPQPPPTARVARRGRTRSGPRSKQRGIACQAAKDSKGPDQAGVIHPKSLPHCR